MVDYPLREEDEWRRELRPIGVVLGIEEALAASEATTAAVLAARKLSLRMLEPCLSVRQA